MANAKKSESWYLSTDLEQIRKVEIDQDGLWIAAEQTLRSDIETTIIFTSGSGNASGVSVEPGISIFPGKTPVPVEGGLKELAAINGAQEALDVQFYPKGTITLDVSALPAATTLKATVVQ